MKKQDNLEFWEKQAEKYKEDISAINFDSQQENIELHFLKNVLKNNQVIADMGCGNGRTIFNMLNQGIKSDFHGFDMTKGMIEIASQQKREQNIDNAFFYNISATSKELSNKFKGKFDTVFTKRLLINIKGKEKYDAIDSIYEILKPNGIYIMIENFIEPLNRINDMREELQLDKINVHPFNEYLDNNIFEKIKDQFTIEKVNDFESLFYFVSRIFNAALSDGPPSYDSKINKIAKQLTKSFNVDIKGYSPQVMYILRKVN